MGRLLRILWTTFAAASLLLCVAAAGVWVRSYYAHDDFDHCAGGRTWTIRVGGGRLGIVREDVAPQPWPDGCEGAWLHEARPLDERPPGPAHILADRWTFNFAGAAHATRTIDGRDANDRVGYLGLDRFDARLLVVHLAYPTTLFSLTPLAWLVGHRKRRRRAARARAGLCASCGYDLRASPGRCPECGASAELTRDHRGGRGDHVTP